MSNDPTLHIELCAKCGRVRDGDGAHHRPPALELPCAACLGHEFVAAAVRGPSPPNEASTRTKGANQQLAEHLPGLYMAAVPDPSPPPTDRNAEIERLQEDVKAAWSGLARVVPASRSNPRTWAALKANVEAAVRQHERAARDAAWQPISTMALTEGISASEWREKAARLEAALAEERAKVQRETLHTSTLLQLMQEARKRFADSHVSHWDGIKRHDPGQSFDDCWTCWFRETAAALLTDDTDSVLSAVRAHEAGAAAVRGPALPADPDETDTAHHPFVPSEADSAFCDVCGETRTWHPVGGQEQVRAARHDAVRFTWATATEHYKGELNAAGALMEATLAAEQDATIRALARAEAAERALREIEALPDLGPPPPAEDKAAMGRLIGYQDAALIARRALADPAPLVLLDQPEEPKQ